MYLFHPADTSEEMVCRPLPDIPLHEIFLGLTINEFTAHWLLLEQGTRFELALTAWKAVVLTANTNPADLRQKQSVGTVVQ